MPTNAPESGPYNCATCEKSFTRVQAKARHMSSKEHEMMVVFKARVVKQGLVPVPEISSFASPSS